jgi:thioredoxin reductase
MTPAVDVLVIGGGPAGLTAAMALGRMGRSTLICDDARPRNAAAVHINNLPAQDGVSPAVWRRQVMKDLEKYPTVDFQQDAVLSVTHEGSRFRGEFGAREAAQFRKVILAYGVIDVLPSLPGFRELWGTALFHCPYCHGFEVRDRRLGLIANGPRAEHLLAMIHSLAKDVVLFTDGQAELTDEFRRHLESKNLRLVEGRIKWLAREGAELRAVVLESGEVFERDFLFLAPATPFRGKSQVGEHLGCKTNEGGFYDVSKIGETSVEGVFAAGDIVSGHHSVLGAAATGQLAAAGVVSQLVMEDLARNSQPK